MWLHHRRVGQRVRSVGSTVSGWLPGNVGVERRVERQPACCARNPFDRARGEVGQERPVRSGSGCCRCRARSRGRTFRRSALRPPSTTAARAEYRRSPDARAAPGCRDRCPRAPPVVLSAIWSASVRSVEERRRRRQRHARRRPSRTGCSSVTAVLRPAVAARRRARNGDRFFVDERQRIAAADRGPAILRDVPGEPDGRPEVVQVLLVELAVDERHRRRSDRASLANGPSSTGRKPRSSSSRIGL